MSKLFFRGAFLRHMVIQDDESGIFCRIHVTAEATKEVLEEMGWSFGLGNDGGDLEGEISATHVIFTPTDAALKQHETQLSCHQISDFKWAKVTDKGAQSSRYEIRFVMRTSEPGASGKIENLKRCGVSAKKPGLLMVNYEPMQNVKKTDQEQLDLEPPEEDSTEDSATADLNCEQCQAGIALWDGDPTMHASGIGCTAAKKDEPALAPATLMGGTHQKGTRNRRRRNPEAEAFADGSAPDAEESETVGIQ